MQLLLFYCTVNPKHCLLGKKSITMILLQFTAFYDEVSLLLIAISVFFSYLILSLSVLSLQHCESGNAEKKKTAKNL